MDRDTEADFHDFVVARSPALLGTAYLLTGDRHRAEDLVQSALAKALRHCPAGPCYRCRSPRAAAAASPSRRGPRRPWYGRTRLTGPCSASGHRGPG
jgi:hypothetical protein